MGVKLAGKADDAICIDDMEDGEIGVVVAWKHSVEVGQIVKRCDDDLINIGTGKRGHYYGYFGSARVEESRVRILQPGERIEITSD